ncbi:sn-glycerol-3-phosphate ABC transporter ATP-binding protein UgpC [Shinella sp.]|uniref:ABC transporter ATP-binding protein n=1 Tax=Shinella sp. TaxID=1870904 RepID=UPI002583DD02|nr:sn-glycerol-3-phosphate ABC transporter ATP-binding protein UgpC [Shinella sp.]MCW5706868.1 sn-glycerol-3-phosphate ABC transporter ATP-binding protein UgpC [Shinella sp.]
MAQIECKGVMKSYGALTIVPNFNLSVRDHEFIVFLGPSGCGKSTILRMIAGLEDISGGELSIGGTVVNDLEPGDRGVAMVFQNYALYPHMSIRDNIAFGLKRQKVPPDQIAKRVEAVATMLGLTPVLARKPTELSGGQQQRVAIARAMIKTPQVFLFDEPLSNLDAKLRAHMRVEIARLHKELKTTTVYVTHDQMEAMTLADRIVLLNGGEIEQVGTPEEIYERPSSLFVASFIGTPAMNLVPMEVISAEQTIVLQTGRSKLSIPKGVLEVHSGQKVVLGIRPADFRLGGLVDNDDVVFSGRVEMVEFHGDQVLALVDCDGAHFSALVPSRLRPIDGSDVHLHAASTAFHLFDAESGRNLLGG